jgi:hypothetical protein
MSVKEDLAGCAREARIRPGWKRASQGIAISRALSLVALRIPADLLRAVARLITVHATGDFCLASSSAGPDHRAHAGVSDSHPVGSSLAALALVLAVTLSIVVAASGQDITATGGWTETIDASDLQSGAGSDLVGTYNSGAGASVISVTYATSWRVDVRRTDGTWQTDFSLYSQRTSDGTGAGTISGGTAYIEITGVDTEFFSGTQDRSDVGAGYELTGMSIDAAPATYNTTVTFTIVSTD